MKRQDIKRRPLADSVILSLEPEEKDYQERDSKGLYLRVKRTGSKSWLLRYKRPPDGKWSWKGIGGYPEVSGKRARTEAAKLLRRVADGEDIHTLNQQDELTVEELSALFIEHKKAQGKADNTIRILTNVTDKHINKAIGNRSVSSVTRLDCNRLIKHLEAQGLLSVANVAQKTLRQVYSFGIASGYCDINPASELRHIFIGYTPTNHPFLVESELGEFVVRLRRSDMHPQMARAIHILLRTVSRPSMMLWMHWDEISLSKATWTIPASKMKMKKEHIIPLPTQTVAELSLINDRSGYVFPAIRKRASPVMGDASLSRALINLGYRDRLVPHGLRHTASTILRDKGWDKQLVESQLAHVEGGVAGIYNKAKYLEQRREMMQYYADHIEKLCSLFLK